MPRRKDARNCKILPWVSARLDNREGRFLQIGNSLFLSKAFQGLKPGAAILYLCLANEAGGKSVLEFSHGQAKKYGFPSTSFDRYVKELEEKGFIRRLPPPGGELFIKAQFEFISTWKENPLPTLGKGKG